MTLAPMTDSLDQLCTEFRDKGYVVIDCPFDPARAAYVQELVRENVDMSNADGVRLSRIDPRYTVVDTQPAVLELLEHPQLLSIVSALYGSNDYRVLLANFNNRTPDVKPMINWHTDYSEEERPLGRRVEIAWYLTDTSPENGCLRVIPGSHTPPRDKTRRELEKVAETTGALWRSHQVRHPHEVELPLGPGKLLIRDGFIWHCTFKNTTQDNRLLYAWSYCPLAERVMLVDYELILPRDIVEFPTPLQERLFALNESYRATLNDRFGQPVASLRDRLGYERDRDFRASWAYKDGEDARFQND